MWEAVPRRDAHRALRGRLRTDAGDQAARRLLEREMGRAGGGGQPPRANGSIAAAAAGAGGAGRLTVMITTNSPHGADPGADAAAALRPVADFTALCRMGTDIFVFAVNEQPRPAAWRIPRLGGRASRGRLTCASGNTTGVVGRPC